MASTRAALQVFEQYQKARVTFVQTVAELATRPQVRPARRAGRGEGRAALEKTTVPAPLT